MTQGIERAEAGRGRRRAIDEVSKRVFVLEFTSEFVQKIINRPDVFEFVGVRRVCILHHVASVGNDE